ncbi:hypothetical protein ElyMa_003573300 [Elysia marginata]|uniref:Carboxylesterase type B domain-containing protein n=1 Tax=Elysia marginata TaxID=1093978 RepID=A0AAV4EMU7_9GAST|nr:hypothetical protein ElyMa_003573300 [Elysia marginata]
MESKVVFNRRERRSLIQKVKPLCLVRTAASWLLQAIYTSLLTSVANLGGPSSSPGEDTSTTSDLAAHQLVMANTTSGVLRGKVDNSSQPTIFRYLGVPYARPPLGKEIACFSPMYFDVPVF